MKMAKELLDKGLIDQAAYNRVEKNKQLKQQVLKDSRTKRVYPYNVKKAASK